MQVHSIIEIAQKALSIVKGFIFVLYTLTLFQCIYNYIFLELFAYWLDRVFCRQDELYEKRDFIYYTRIWHNIFLFCNTNRSGLES